MPKIVSIRLALRLATFDVGYHHKLRLLVPHGKPVRVGLCIGLSPNGQWCRKLSEGTKAPCTPDKIKISHLI